MRGLGWSLPPGVTTRMIDEAAGVEGPCDMCGKMVDDCICPECPQCHAQGDPKCYQEHGLVCTPEQIASLTEAKAAQAAEIAAENWLWDQLQVDEAYYDAQDKGDLANAIGWASRRSGGSTL